MGDGWMMVDGWMMGDDDWIGQDSKHLRSENIEFSEFSAVHIHMDDFWMMLDEVEMVGGYGQAAGPLSQGWFFG